jgi:glycosyltransferase involved in cell wall biosynthesis
MNSKTISISIIIPVYNGIKTLRQCLEAATNQSFDDYECIVVDDGSKDGSVETAKQFPVRVIELSGGPSGPAYARNRGAEVARGDVLFFVDADVIIPLDTLHKIAATFQQHPEISALFGSYDESPVGGEFLSQYKNLLHHFVHQQGQEDAATFWSGCGAVLRKVFLQVGGFDADRYPRPSIEDIELGCRLRASGYKIFLNKDIQVTHMKHWSLSGLIRTDVFNRAIPWTLLIMQERNIPNDLNLNFSQRISALLLLIILVVIGINAFHLNLLFLPLLTGLFLLLAGSWQRQEGSTFFQMSKTSEKFTYMLMGVIGVLALFSHETPLIPFLALLLPLTLVGSYLTKGEGLVKNAVYSAMMVVFGVGFTLLFASYPPQLVIPLIILLALIMLLNNQLYLFFARKRGIVFALAALPLQLLYYFYSMVAFVISSGIYFWNTNLKPRRSY